MAWAAVRAHAAPVDSADDPAPIDEVIVTAQRTAGLASRTPVALSVVSGARLQEDGTDRPSALAARLPNVHLDGAADGLKITIRGVSNADTTEKGDPSAAFMLDGIYIARPQSQNVSFYDIDRIEVLRGPQGTLYGRNTTAGVVNVISNAPRQRFEAAFSAELGNYNSRKASAMLNLPAGPALALRAAVAANRRHSYLNNAQGTPHRLGLDRDDRSARLSALLALGPRGALLLRHERGTVQDNNDSFVPDSNFFTGVGSATPAWYAASTAQRLTNSFVPPNRPPEQGFSHKRTRGTSAELSWAVAHATLHYLGARRNASHDALANFYYRVAPGFALGVRQRFSGDYAQDSHELRIATSGSGRLAAQAGLYYFREESAVVYSFRDLELLGLPPYYVFPHGPTVANSRAVFGQASYQLDGGLRLTVGARYTDDAKSRVGSTNFQQGETFNPALDLKLLNAAALDTRKTTWRLGAEYAPAPATLLYGTIATGYKAGGFNDGCLAGTRELGIDCPAALAVPAATLFYQPETLTSYEAGLKTRWRDRASLNLAAFSYRYSNLQLSGVAVVQGAPRYVTANAGVASVKGLELDGQVSLTAADQLSYGLTLLDAHYVRYAPNGVDSWAGRKLDRAPGRTLMLGYQHRFRIAGGALAAAINTRARSAYSIGVPSQLLQYRIPRRVETDISLRYRADGAAWRMQARVMNLENKVAPIAIDSFGMAVPSAPRTLHLRFDYTL